MTVVQKLPASQPQPPGDTALIERPRVKPQVEPRFRFLRIISISLLILGIVTMIGGALGAVWFATTPLPALTPAGDLVFQDPSLESGIQTLLLGVIAGSVLIAFSEVLRLLIAMERNQREVADWLKFIGTRR